MVALCLVVAWPEYLAGFNTPLGKVLWLALILLLSQRNQVAALLAVAAFIRILGLQKKFTPTVQPLAPSFLPGVDSNATPFWRSQDMVKPTSDETYAMF